MQCAWLCFCDSSVTRGKQQSSATKPRAHLGGIHNPKVIYPEKIEAVEPFGLHVILFPNIGQLRPEECKE
jgi:hypothetical protein